MVTATYNPAAPGTVNQVASSYTMPDYINKPSQDIGGFLQDYYQSMINPQTGITGGYQGQMTAAINPLQQSALSQAPNAVGAWGTQFAQGTDALNSAASRAGTLGQYDPAAMQQHLNPYLGGVLEQIQTMGNRNLFENTLPNVNSTFTGAGQFGSTRNGDFTNRALRDNQQAISNAQGTAMNQAYGQAANDYLGWNNAGQSATGLLGNIGQTLSSTALQGGQQNWNDISNLFKMGESERAIGQEGLTADYNNWQNTWNQPLDMTTKLSSILTQLKSGINPTSLQANTTTSDPNAGTYDFLRQILGGII